MDTENYLKEAAHQLLQKKPLFLQTISKLNVRNLSNYFITESAVLSQNICDEVNAGLEKGNNVKIVRYIDKTHLGVVLENPIIPVKVFLNNGRVYIVKNNMVIRDDAKIGYIVFEINSNKDFNCKIYHNERKDVAHHANVQRESGNLCLGDIHGVNNITKINFETLQILLRSHNYNSPHNGDPMYVFTKNFERMIHDHDIEEYSGSLRV